MLKTFDEIKDAEFEAGVVVNGVDNPNVLSIDSTEPEPTKAEEVKEPDKESAEDVLDVAPVKKKEEKVEAEEEEEKKEEKEEKKEEKKAKEKDKKEEVKSDEDDASISDSKKVVKRISKLTKNWRTAEREAKFERDKRLKAEAKLKELSRKLSAEEGKPLKEDFDNEDDYIEALTDWKIKQVLGASQEDEETETEEKEEKEAVAQTYTGLDDAMEKGSEKYNDFDKVVLDEDLVISTELTQILLDTDIPEDIMYYLATNPDESARISELDPIRIAKEVGKIEVKLEKVGGKEEKSKPPKKQSKAPEPITPVRANSDVEKDPNKMSPKEYRAWREKMSK